MRTDEDFECELCPMALPEWCLALICPHRRDEPRPPPPNAKSGPRLHALKTWPPYFEAIAAGAKPFELRRDDRQFAVGDLLRLIEFDPSAARPTGRETTRAVTYVLRDSPEFGLAAGFVILGLAAR